MYWIVHYKFVDLASFNYLTMLNGQSISNIRTKPGILRKLQNLSSCKARLPITQMRQTNTKTHLKKITTELINILTWPHSIARLLKESFL